MCTYYILSSTLVSGTQQAYNTRPTTVFCQCVANANGECRESSDRCYIWIHPFQSFAVNLNASKYVIKQSTNSTEYQFFFYLNKI